MGKPYACISLYFDIIEICMNIVLLRSDFFTHQVSRTTLM